MGGAVADWAQRLMTNSALRLRWVEGLAVVFGVLGAALLAERACEALLRRARRRSRELARQSGWRRVAAIIGDIGLVWAPLLAFAAAGYGSLAALLTFGAVEPAARAATLAVLGARLVTGVVIAAAAAALAPSPGAAGLDEETANYWLIWVSRLTRLAAYGYFALAFALAVGANPAAVDLLTRLTGLAFVSLLVMLVLQNRAAVAGALRGRDPADPHRILPQMRAGAARSGPGSRSPTFWPAMVSGHRPRPGRSSS